MSIPLAKDRVGLLSYSLTDEDGTLIETTGGGRLFVYLHGHKNLPDTMEAVVDGLEAGAEFDQRLPNAFGEAADVKPQAVRKKDLPKHVRDRLEVGFRFAAEGGDGTVVTLWVTDIRGAQVWITNQHPLAGKALRFAGRVERVREATPDELAHGHAHGPDGHHAD